ISLCLSCFLGIPQGHFPSREIKDEHFLFCIAAKTFPITSGTIFFYQNVALIESFYQICE
ncbi:hypothetical protein, partial [Escherichia coli]|uniref:hypothetical protein n=1 Tax=Escherichia coli TaxID=562 RepID=UPI001BC84378